MKMQIITTAGIVKKAAMCDMEQRIQDINLKIKTDTILLFDLDGTLVDTDFANFLSYRDAIKSVIQNDVHISYDPNKRFNRSSLKTILPNLTDKEYKYLIRQKEEKYEEHLSRTKINKNVADILIKYFKTNQSVLVTNCREDRAIMTLNYHGLTDKFNNIIFRKASENRNRVNKYENAISQLDLPTKLIVIFENEKSEIQDAVLAGILIENILSI